MCEIVCISRNILYFLWVTIQQLNKIMHSQPSIYRLFFQFSPGHGFSFSGCEFPGGKSISTPWWNSPGYTASRWTLSCSRWAAAARCSRCSRSSLAALWAASARGMMEMMMNQCEGIDWCKQATYNEFWVKREIFSIWFIDVYCIQNVGSANSQDGSPSNIGHPWSSTRPRQPRHQKVTPKG